MEDKKLECIFEKYDSLCSLINEYDGDKYTIILELCSHLISLTANSHFEGLGMLEELKIHWRDESLEFIEENLTDEDDNICPDCKEKAKLDIEKNLEDIK